MRRCTIFLLLFALGACTGARAAPSPTVRIAPAQITPTPTNAELSGTLLRQIQEYESIYYAAPATSRDAGDWGQTDQALQSWFPQRPLFADYYRWVARKYERDPSSRDAFRYPAVLRANVNEYLNAAPESRAGGAASAAPVALLKQPVRISNWELTAVDWDNWGERDLPWSAAGDVLHNDTSWVVLIIAMTNITQTARTVNPGDFQVRDSYNRIFPYPAQPGAAALSAYRGGSAWDRPVSPGTTAYYYLPFQVIPSFGVLSLIFNQDWRPIILIADSAGTAALAPMPTPTPTPAATAAPTPLPTPAAALRLPVRVGNWELTVVDWDNWGRRDLPWSAAGDVLHADGRWVVLIVTVTNIGQESLAVNPADFQMRDASGRVYPFPSQPGAIALSKYRGGSTMGDPVYPGTTAYYYVPFQVVPNPGSLSLIFNQGWRPVIFITDY